jgi:hypothetical protein
MDSTPAKIKTFSTLGQAATRTSRYKARDSEASTSSNKHLGRLLIWNDRARYATRRSDLAALIVCSTCTPLAQINPVSSRPTAVTTLCLVFPLEQQLGKTPVQAMLGFPSDLDRSAGVFLPRRKRGPMLRRYRYDQAAGGATAGLLGGAARLRVC